MTAANSPRKDDTEMVIPDFVIESLACCLLPQMQEYFSSPERQAAFEEWKRQQKDT